MADIVENTAHIVEALGRRLERYKESPNFEDLLATFVKDIQELETAVVSFENSRWIDDAEGVQLDNIGDTVGQPRLGYEDPFYRVLIYVKIAINNSQGDPVAIKSIFKLLTTATICHFRYLTPGNISLMSDGFDPVDDGKFIYDQMDRVVAGGVQIDTLGFYSDNAQFTFDGALPTGLVAGGFSSLTTAYVGGKFPILLRKIPLVEIPFFGFDGDDDTIEGFGDLDDPTAGGFFET